MKHGKHKMNGHMMSDAQHAQMMGGTKPMAPKGGKKAVRKRKGK
ncbi:MAG TPA: hypothetical protein VJA25_02640 [Dehalococcoidia bacterium]|nr:hypothetical protein [Dehalococcoidia bacterium]